MSVGAISGGYSASSKPAGTVLTAVQSDTNGSFTIPGLSAGEYHLVISHADFETKEVPLTVEASETSATLRITLALSGVSTTR